MIPLSKEPRNGTVPSPARNLHNIPPLPSASSPASQMVHNIQPQQPIQDHTPAESTFVTASSKTPSHTFFDSCLGSALRWFQHKKAKAQRRIIRRKEKLAERDHERQTEGLLRIALRPRNDSVNSFTPADPGIFYRRDREGQDHWVRQEGKISPFILFYSCVDWFVSLSADDEKWKLMRTI
ncbi:hypothetical protein NU219Hw_g3926t1 [Hortaea werneckii]